MAKRTRRTDENPVQKMAWRATTLQGGLTTTKGTPIQSRSWCFTINNYTTDDEARLEAVFATPRIVRGTIGREVGDAGTPHLQGWCKFDKKLRMPQVKKWIGERAHVEAARGTELDNCIYCEKGGDVRLEKGTAEIKAEAAARREAGTKDGAKWKQLIDDAEAMTVAEFKDAHPDQWVLRRSAIERLMIDAAMTRAAVWSGILTNKNVWIWGAPGLGKSRWAMGQCDIQKTYIKNTNKWWDGYMPLRHMLVIIDDYPCLPHGDCLCHHMKNWGDRYPFNGETKGSGLLIMPGSFLMIVTSNYPISGCFSNEEDVKALKRRFKEVELTIENQAIIGQTRMDLEQLVQTAVPSEADQEW
jgi:hypothetical protein